MSQRHAAAVKRLKTQGSITMLPLAATKSKQEKPRSNNSKKSCETGSYHVNQSHFLVCKVGKHHKNEC
jgi:hypothetical protein